MTDEPGPFHRSPFKVLWAPGANIGEIKVPENQQVQNERAARILNKVLTRKAPLYGRRKPMWRPDRGHRYTL